MREVSLRSRWRPTRSVGLIWTRAGIAKISLALYIFLAAIFIASPQMVATDSRWSIHAAMSIAHDRGGDLSQYFPILQKEKLYAIEYPDGRPRSYYPAGPSLLAAPMVGALGWLFPGWAATLPYSIPHKTPEIIASLLGALSAVIFYWLMLSRIESQPIALASTVIFALGTSMWSTATRTLWQHGPLVLMLVITMLILERARKRPELVQYAGLSLAMAYLMRPTAILPIVVLSGYVLIFHRSHFVNYICWAMLMGIAWTTWNFTIYGRLLPPYYRANAISGRAGFMVGMMGSLFSPSRGLFVFSPVLLFSASGFLLALRARADRALHLAYGTIVAGHVFIVGSSWMWWGGHGFGPRLMTDVVPFFAYFTAFNFRLPETFQRRTQVVVSPAIGLLALVSIAIHAQGAFRYATWEWNYVPANIDLQPDRVWDWRDPQFLRTRQ